MAGEATRHGAGASPDTLTMRRGAFRFADFGIFSNLGPAGGALGRAQPLSGGTVAFFFRRP